MSDILATAAIIIGCIIIDATALYMVWKEIDRQEREADARRIHLP